MKKLSAIFDLFPGGFKGIGPLGNPTGTGIDTFTKFISSTIGLMTIIAIIWFIFTLITGAIAMTTAGSDKASLENARKKITNGLIGLVVTIAAIFIIDIVGNLIGIPDILNLPALFTQIQK